MKGFVARFHASAGFNPLFDLSSQGEGEGVINQWKVYNTAI